MVSFGWAPLKFSILQWVYNHPKIQIISNLPPIEKSRSTSLSPEGKCIGLLVCSYSFFLWLVFLNFLKIFGCVVPLTNDGLYWIVKVAGTYSVCFCLGLFPHEASHLSGNQADWRFCVSRESQGNVLTGSLFQVPLGKKQVAEQEPRSRPSIFHSQKGALSVTLNL